MTDIKIKGLTTAKKGTIITKSGHGKDTLKLDFLENVAFNDKITIKELVLQHEKALKEQEQRFNEKISKLSTEHEKALNQAITDIKQSFENKLETIVKEMLSL